MQSYPGGPLLNCGVQQFLMGKLSQIRYGETRMLTPSYEAIEYSGTVLDTYKNRI